MAKQSVFEDPAAFRRQIRMAAVQVAGLRPSELEMALAYEIEPSSGVPASEAELEFRSIADDDPTIRVYEVAVRRRAQKSGVGGERWLKPLAVAGAAVVLVVVADAVLTRHCLTGLGQEVARREKLDAQIKSVRREVQQKRDEAAAVRNRREAAEKAQNEVARFRSAWSELMRVIADACGERAVVRQIVSEGAFKVKLSATAVSAQAAAEVIVALSGAAARLNWQLRPGVTSASAATATFDCELSYD